MVLDTQMERAVVLMVKVKLFATLIELTGRRRLELDGVENVGEILNRLDELFPGFKKELEKGFIVLVNGKNVEHLNGLATPVSDDDTVSIFPPAGGG